MSSSLSTFACFLRKLHQISLSIFFCVRALSVTKDWCAPLLFCVELCYFSYMFMFWSRDKGSVKRHLFHFSYIFETIVTSICSYKKFIDLQKIVMFVCIFYKMKFQFLFLSVCVTNFTSGKKIFAAKCLQSRKGIAPTFSIRSAFSVCKSTKPAEDS